METPTYTALPKQRQEDIQKAYRSGQHVYFIKSKRLQLVKIGCATDPNMRLKSLQTGSPAKLELVHVIPYGGYLIEKQLHDHFRHLRQHGEWFTNTRLIKDCIRSTKQIMKETGLKWDLKKGRIVEWTTRCSPPAKPPQPNQ